MFSQYFTIIQEIIRDKSKKHTLNLYIVQLRVLVEEICEIDRLVNIRDTYLNIHICLNRRR